MIWNVHKACLEIAASLAHQPKIHHTDALCVCRVRADHAYMFFVLERSLFGNFQPQLRRTRPKIIISQWGTKSKTFYEDEVWYYSTCSTIGFIAPQLQSLCQASQRAKSATIYNNHATLFDKQL